MGDLLNLRQARKRAERAEREKAAAENRRLHGRTGAEKQAARTEKARAEAHLDAHRLVRPGEDERG